MCKQANYMDINANDQRLIVIHKIEKLDVQKQHEQHNYKLNTNKHTWG